MMKFLILLVLSVFAKRPRGGRPRGGPPRRPPWGRRPSYCSRRSTAVTDELRQSELSRMAQGFYSGEATSYCYVWFMDTEWPHFEEEEEATETAATDAPLLRRNLQKRGGRGKGTPKPAAKFSVTNGVFSKDTQVRIEGEFECYNVNTLQFLLSDLQESWTTTEAPATDAPVSLSDWSRRGSDKTKLEMTISQNAEITMDVDCMAPIVQDPDVTDTESCVATEMTCGGSYTYKAAAGTDETTHLRMKCKTEEWTAWGWEDAPASCSD